MRAKFRELLRWAGPVAIGGGVFAALSELMDLPVTVPGISGAEPTGYDAVGAGVILIALTLLMVGVIGLYARQDPAGRTGREEAYQEEVYQELYRRLEEPETPPEPVARPEEVSMVEAGSPAT